MNRVRWPEIINLNGRNCQLFFDIESVTFYATKMLTFCCDLYDILNVYVGFDKNQQQSVGENGPLICRLV